MDKQGPHTSEHSPIAANGSEGRGHTRLSPAEISAALEQARAFGVDLEALRENLRLTTEQRLQRLQAGLRMVASLRNARDVRDRSAY